MLAELASAGTVNATLGLRSRISRLTVSRGRAIPAPVSLKVIRIGLWPFELFL